jgi:septal ring factor EnvC (AmiA/AmiB activator)
LQEKRTGTLREQLATIRPQLEALRQKKEDRSKQFLEVKRQIASICGEIAATPSADFYQAGGDQDLSLRRLEEYNVQLQVLQKERVSHRFVFPQRNDLVGYQCAHHHVIFNMVEICAGLFGRVTDCTEFWST